MVKTVSFGDDAGVLLRELRDTCHSYGFTHEDAINIQLFVDACKSGNDTTREKNTVLSILNPQYQEIGDDILNKWEFRLRPRKIIKSESNNISDQDVPDWLRFLYKAIPESIKQSDDRAMVLDTTKALL